MSSEENAKLNEIARQAERDLNSYQSKTGSGRDRATDYEPAGVSDINIKKFPGSTIKYGDEFVSSKSYDRRIPPDEGGDIDDHGRYIHGHAYEGIGGPEDKMAHIYQHNSGGMDESTIKKWGKNPLELESKTVKKDRPDLIPDNLQEYAMEDEPPHHGEPMERGRLAGKMNLGLDENSRAELPTHRTKENQFRGSDYETPEAVPDSRSDQNEVPPKSVTERSKRAQGI